MHTNPAEPLVEVILPTLLDGRSEHVTWLDEAVESVLGQTWSRCILTLVDDASPRPLRPIVERWAERHPERIRLVAKDRRAGAANARMDVAERSNADYLAFLDQDDLWHREKIERQLEYLSGRPECRAVHTNLDSIDASGQPSPGKADAENAKRDRIDHETISVPDLARHVFRSSGIRLVSSMVERRAFLDCGGFDRTLDGGEDWEFWVRFTSRFPVGHLSAPLTFKRAHDANTSQVLRLRRTRGRLVALEKIVRARPCLADEADAVRGRIRSTIERLETADRATRGSG